MPGCLSYIVANDPVDPNLIWITEAWESKEAHAASLSLPSVKDAITKGRPLICRDVKGRGNIACRGTRPCLPLSSDFRF
jgi:quinol monooxygenase YgiN